MQAKKVILGSGRLRAGSIIAEEEMAICEGDETSYLRLRNEFFEGLQTCPMVPPKFFWDKSTG